MVFLTRKRRGPHSLSETIPQKYGKSGPIFLTTEVTKIQNTITIKC